MLYVLEAGISQGFFKEHLVFSRCREAWVEGEHEKQRIHHRREEVEDLYELAYFFFSRDELG